MGIAPCWQTGVKAIGDSASLYVGVAIPFYESITTLRSTDATFAKRLTENPPPHPTWRE